MASSGMLHRVALLRTDAAEKHIAYVIGVIRIGVVGTKSAVTSKYFFTATACVGC
jgi:hypothetical protein